MELRTFVKTALLDIVGGVRDAQSVAEGATIVPRTGTHLDAAKSGLTAYQIVEFEVSVRVDESAGTEGKIGVVGSLIGAGISREKSNDSSEASTIRFKVPVLFDATGEPITPPKFSVGVH